jgi:predicted DNA-binding ribbon-helix-helix protein
MSPGGLTIRNVVVAGHRTSVRLEPIMWDALREIARERVMGLNQLVTEIDERRNGLSLTAAIRVYIVDFYRAAALDTAHSAAAMPV